MIDDNWEETSLVDLVLATDPDHITPECVFLWKSIGSWIQIQYRRYVFHRLSDIFADPALKKRLEDKFEGGIRGLSLSIDEEDEVINFATGDEPVIDPRTLREIEGGK